MTRSLLFKIATLMFLTVILMIPMMRIGWLVRERQAARDAVVQDIARSAGYAQTLTGPLLRVPYRHTVREWTDGRDGAKREITSIVNGALYFLPSSFGLDGKLATEERQRGIYRARIYNADTTLNAVFDVPANFGVTEGLADYAFETPVLALGISDIRGIGNALKLSINGATMDFEPGSGTPLLGSGVHATLGAFAAAPQKLSLTIALRLQGTGDFQITPVGRESKVALTSDWPHPSFVGEFLPYERSIDSHGFTAKWQTSFFSTALQTALTSCAAVGNPKAPECAEFQGRHFGVSFVDPVDQYLKTNRATQYGFLFIALTFAGFFLFEVLRRFNVHPVQYGLVGMALAMFFMLLLSLSEHLGFGLAYLVSAAACVGLIGYYVSHVLQNRTHGALFAAALAVLYGLLYGILGSEDYALLMGSLLVFALLALVMVLTRKVNWAGFGQTAHT
jgi:inner membrane protein